MISLIQRVTKAEVSIKEKTFSSIGKGYVIFLGIFEEDTETDVNKLIEKIINLRIMSDDQDKMNLSILDVQRRNPCSLSIYALCRFNRRSTTIIY